MNLDETGCFWQALPNRGFNQKGKYCAGGKKSKCRIIIAFIVSAAGKKEKPVVIWKYENPRCFKRFDKNLLPVSYYSQSKAWMNGEIMELILTKLNHRFASLRRKILLLMDNAGCHPGELKGKVSNIKIVFLPANTTSKLQPLHLGIIQNFKVHYRKMLLQHVFTRIDQCNHASGVVKSINILASVRWVAVAWEKVKPETIMKCFRKAGILRDDMSDIVTRPHESVDFKDPFVEADECMDLQHLIDQALPSEQSC